MATQKRRRTVSGAIVVLFAITSSCASTPTEVALDPPAATTGVDVGTEATASPTTSPSARLGPAPGPVLNVDHWHAIYAVYDCTQPTEERFLPPFTSTDNPVGIHSHGDGLIHIHPYFGRSAGDNATLSHWLEAMHLTLTNDTFILESGRTLSEGVPCADGSGPAQLAIHHWDFDFFATTGEGPNSIITADFADVAFDNDREVYVIVFAGPTASFDADSGLLPPPERFDALNNVGAEIEFAGS